MVRIIIGSHIMKADSKEELLAAINERWDWFYAKNWTSGRFGYEGMLMINDKYFHKDFYMTPGQAEKEFNNLREYSSELFLYAKFKLMWYIKYAEEEFNPNQTVLDDFLEDIQ